jgi:hypothetical protein
MTFTMTAIVSGKRMVKVFWRQRPFLNKITQHLFKKLNIIASLDTILNESTGVPVLH